MSEPLSGDIYRHYKGGIYQIIAVGMHVETYKMFVTYFSIPYQKIWVRDLDEWHKAVEVDGMPLLKPDGTPQPRFERLGPTFTKLQRQL